MFYKDEILHIKIESSEIPWLVIFTNKEFRELSDLDDKTREYLFCASMICERSLIEFYKPDKINHASFANYLPRVHWHIQARFKDDSFFPESMWGKRQRDGVKRDLNLSKFCDILSQNLKKNLPKI